MAVLGNERKVYLNLQDSGVPSASAWIAGELNNSFNRTAEGIDTSDKSTEWEQFLSGKKGATAEVTVYLDDLSDGPQCRALEALYEGNGMVRVFVGRNGSSAQRRGDVFSAIVTSVSDANDNGSVSTRTISLTATGEVTHYPSLS